MSQLKGASMSLPSKTSRRRLAFLISIILHAVILVCASFVDWRTNRISAVGRAIDTLGRPAGVIVERLYPGHTLNQAAVLILISICLYMIPAWLVLTGWSWICDHHRRVRSTGQNAGHP